MTALETTTAVRVADLLRGSRYEVIPLDGIEEQVVEHVPRELTLTVTASPTKGLDPTLSNGAREGVGLRTTRARLSKLYGEAQELALVNVPGGGFETRVLLPFRRRQESLDENSLSGR